MFHVGSAAVAGLGLFGTSASNFSFKDYLLSFSPDFQSCNVKDALGL